MCESCKASCWLISSATSVYVYISSISCCHFVYISYRKFLLNPINFFNNFYWARFESVFSCFPMESRNVRGTEITSDKALYSFSRNSVLAIETKRGKLVRHNLLKMAFMPRRNVSSACGRWQAKSGSNEGNSAACLRERFRWISIYHSYSRDLCRSHFTNFDMFHFGTINMTTHYCRGCLFCRNLNQIY